MKGVNVAGKNYNNLRYADDTALLAGDENELSELTSKINEVGKQFGMKINIKKTKAMVVSKKPDSPKINIAIDGQQIVEPDAADLTIIWHGFFWEIFFEFFIAFFSCTTIHLW